MSSGDPSPSASGTVASLSKFEMAIQQAHQLLRLIFSDQDDDDEIRQNLIHAWTAVWQAISQAGSPNLKGRLRNGDEFKAYVRRGSDEERELIKLLGSMAKQQVPWEYLFENGTLLSAL
jgi:hypothetical protein